MLTWCRATKPGCVLGLGSAGQVLRSSAWLSAQVIRSDSSRWESLMTRQAVQQGIRHSALATALQKRMEQVVLSETSGSHSQRVISPLLFPLGIRCITCASSRHPLKVIPAGARSRQSMNRLALQPLADACQAVAGWKRMRWYSCFSGFMRDSLHNSQLAGTGVGEIFCNQNDVMRRSRQST